jgi:anti-anti-sigma factor
VVAFLSARGGSLLGVRTLPDPDACRLEPATVVVCRGEVDRSNVEDFGSALARIDLDGSTCLHVHVAELEFIDVGGLALLAELARSVRSTGRTFRTCEARPGLRRAAAIMGLEDDLGLT